MVWLFWFALIFLAYTCVGYPLLLTILSIWRRRPHRQGTVWPTISLIIPAHNEGQGIAAKIKNSLALAYPSEKRQIIVALDGSHEETANIARSFTDCGVKFVEVPERRGKHYAQMVARDVSHGEILVFTDASVHLEPDALQKIVSNFADPCVGCVSSEDLVVTEKNAWMGERFYVEFEMRLRRLEAESGSTVGSSGSFFAARREVCKVWHPEQSSDFFLPLHAVAYGMRAVVDRECRGYYTVVHSEKAELHRKVRTIVHGLDVLFYHRELLNPLRYGFFSWQLASHKLFRWLVPFAAFSLLLSNVFLWEAGGLYRVSLICQLALYGIGALALTAGRLTQFKAFKPFSFFLLGNAATVMAWIYFLSGEKFVAWQPSRRS